MQENLAFAYDSVETENKNKEVIVMYGWRGRIGIIVPSPNTVMEMEFHKMLPKGVAIITNRVRAFEVSVKTFELMESEIEEAAIELADAGVDIIIFGCTLGSLFKGAGYDEKLSSIIQDKTNVKAITTATAVRLAFRALKLSVISVITPYTDEMNQKEKSFFEKEGFIVSSIKGLGYTKNLVTGRQYPESVYQFARDNTTKANCDGLFISCTDFRTLEIIPLLEKDLDKPVISSNQASMWMALRSLKIDDEHLEQFGRLFKLQLAFE